MDDGEIAAFFLELDADLPAAKNNGSNQRLNFEMKILFRMIYCCGLRVLEATHDCYETICAAGGMKGDKQICYSFFLCYKNMD